MKLDTSEVTALPTLASLQFAGLDKKLFLPSTDYDMNLSTILLSYGITGCGIFKAGIQNWKGFCIKINQSQMKLLNFENWTNGEPQ